MKTYKTIHFYIVLLSAFIANASYATTDSSTTMAIPSTEYVNKIVESISDTVRLTGNQTIDGEKTFNGAIKMTASVNSDTSDNTVATTEWTNDKIESTRSKIRVGRDTSSGDFVNMWVE